jgi:hypothetical protein
VPVAALRLLDLGVEAGASIDCTVRVPSSRSVPISGAEIIDRMDCAAMRASPSSCGNSVSAR